MIFGIIGGIVLVAFGILLLIKRRSSLDTILELKSIATSKIGEVLELQRAVAGEIGPGGFNRMIEVTGRVEAPAPITSGISETPCVWFSSKVEERYEETYQETDANGNLQTRVRTATTTVSSDTQSITFGLRDDTGMLLVNPIRADIDGRKSVDRHDPYDPRSGVRLTGGRLTADRKVLGYHYTEHLIPLGAPVYVIGEARDSSGQVTIQQPTDTDKPFIVSMRSEEEVVKGMEGTAAMQKWFGIGLIVIGAAVAIAAVAGVFG